MLLMRDSWRSLGQTKRLNFDISPEQEDELNKLRADLGTSTTKDTVLRAVRVLSVLSREAREGGRLYRPVSASADLA